MKCIEKNEVTELLVYEGAIYHGSIAVGPLRDLPADRYLAFACHCPECFRPVFRVRRGGNLYFRHAPIREKSGAAGGGTESKNHRGAKEVLSAGRLLYMPGYGLKNTDAVNWSTYPGFASIIDVHKEVTVDIEGIRVRFDALLKVRWNNIELWVAVEFTRSSGQGLDRRRLYWENGVPVMEVLLPREDLDDEALCNHVLTCKNNRRWISIYGRDFDQAKVSDLSEYSESGRA